MVLSVLEILFETFVDPVKKANFWDRGVGYSTEKLVVQRQACTQATAHRGQLNVWNQK